MEKQHSPAFLALVRDAKQRVRETTIPELKKRLDARKNSTSSTSARITNGLPGASPGRNTFPRESSSATSKPRSRTGRRRFSSIAVAVIAPRWLPTIFKKWVTSAWFPWTADGGDGQGRGFQSRNQRLRSRTPCPPMKQLMRPYMRACITCSRTSFGGRTLDSGKVASGSSTTFRRVRKFSGLVFT